MKRRRTRRRIDLSWNEKEATPPAVGSRMLSRAPPALCPRRTASGKSDTDTSDHFRGGWGLLRRLPPLPQRE